MRNSTHILYMVIIALLVGVLLFPDKEEPRYIIVPPIEGEFKKDSLAPIEKEEKLYEIVYRDTVIEVPNETDKKLLQDYLDSQDTISQLKLYVQAIQEREYREVFEDDAIEITNNVVATGWVKSMDIKYKIKEHKIELPPNPLIVRVGVKAGVGKDKLQVYPEFSLENRKGTIYSTQIRKDEFLVGAQFPIFKIK